MEDEISSATTRLSAVLVLACLLGPGTCWALAEATEAAAAESAPTFDVWEYRVRGNTLLASPVIERTVYPFLGATKTVADANAAGAALQQAYRDAGYPTVFVDLPEQDVGSGTVVLAVTEGRIGRLTVTGSRYFSNGWIRDHVPAAQPGQVPTLAAFQQQLTALNGRSPDRMLTPVLRPGQAPGTMDVELKVQDQLPVHGSVEVNNRQSADTSATRLSAAVRYDNLWQRDHSFGIQYQVAPEKPSDTEVWVATYLLKPKGSDKTFAFYAFKSDSDIATVGGDVNVIGKGTVAGVRALLPLPSSASFYQSLSLGATYSDLKENVGFTAPGQAPITTPISYVNWTATWGGTRVTESATHNFNTGVNFGVRGVGNSTAEFANKRYKATPDYIDLTGGYDVTIPLPVMETALFWSVKGQLTQQPLISNEQIAAGGLDSVRGYYEAEELGDYGLESSLEVRSPNVGPRLWSELRSFYGFVFTDWAALGLADPLPGQEDSLTLASVGIGLRLNTAGFLTGLDWAVPLRDGTSTVAYQDRLLFSVRYGF